MNVYRHPFLSAVSAVNYLYRCAFAFGVIVPVWFVDTVGRFLWDCKQLYKITMGDIWE